MVLGAWTKIPLRQDDDNEDYTVQAFDKLMIENPLHATNNSDKSPVALLCSANIFQVFYEFFNYISL